MSLVSYRLRLFGRLVGELQIESDGFEITLDAEPDDATVRSPVEHLIWGESEAAPVNDHTVDT